MVKLSGSSGTAKSSKKSATKAPPKAASKAVAKPAPTKPAAAKPAASQTTAVVAPDPVETALTAPAPVAVEPVAAEPVAVEAVAAEPVAVEPKLVTTTVPVVSGPEMKKKDLIDKVVKRAGVKKKDAKPVVEAMLAVLGEALTEGRELVLQPMGRIKVTRVKDTGNGRVLICRLRQGGGDGKGDKEALAEDDD